MPSAAEGIREDDVRASFDEGAVQVGDALWMLDVPQFRRVARLQAAIEQIAAGGAVSQQPIALGQ